MKKQKGEVKMINIKFNPLDVICANVPWPLVDISESKENFSLSFEIPGALKDDIKVWIENDLLLISGEKKGDNDLERLVAERLFGRVERSFKLPRAIDQNNVVAELVDGVLKIKLPKLIEAKEISIN
jgi:HSP20 family protein